MKIGGRKEADRSGKARKRSGREEAEKKGRTGGTAVGAKPGGTKGNEQEAEYENRERRHGKPGWTERGRPRKRKRKRSTEEATVRRRQEERERKNRKLSSWKRNGSGRKKADGKQKSPKAKAKGKHLRTSCGSESGKSERKQTESRVRESGKEA